MSRLIIALCVSSGLGLAGPAVAQMLGSSSPTPATNQEYVDAMHKADAQYANDSNLCAARSGNANDICVAQARGRERIAKAEAEASLARTPMARETARVARAQASYDVAIEKCDDLADKVKDVCVKKAQAQLVKGKSDARVDRVATDTREEARAKQLKARKEVDEASRDAEYRIGIERCDAHAGTAKESCVSGAKLRFGKS